MDITTWWTGRDMVQRIGHGSVVVVFFSCLLLYGFSIFCLLFPLPLVWQEDVAGIFLSTCSQSPFINISLKTWSSFFYAARFASFHNRVLVFRQIYCWTTDSVNKSFILCFWSPAFWIHHCVLSVTKMLFCSSLCILHLSILKYLNKGSKFHFQN